MKKLTYLPLIFLPAFLIGCQKDKIEIYEVSKDSPPATPAGVIPETPQGSSNEIEWKVPRGWRQQPASGMRVGSFLVTGRNGQQADVSVIPLAGEAEGELANINRWRGQLNLGPISETDLPTDSRKMSFGGRKMLYVDLVSREPLIENKYKKRIVAAIYTSNGRIWFFKMIGDDETVESASSAFKEFLKSLRFSPQ